MYNNFRIHNLIKVISFLIKTYNSNNSKIHKVLI
jgi:hypothetical protein